jgi:DNA-binding ferritin-like protein
MSKSIEVTQELERRQEARLITPTDLKAEATRDIAGTMNAILADVFALYLKTKNFHWHMSGPHFRDYHLLFDEQGDQLFAMTDPIAERIRKLGRTAIRSIGHIARLQRVSDNEAARTARHSQRASAKPMASAKNTRTSLLPASSKFGLTRLSGAPGSCSRQPTEAILPGIETPPD